MLRQSQDRETAGLLRLAENAAPAPVFAHPFADVRARLGIRNGNVRWKGGERTGSKFGDTCQCASGIELGAKGSFFVFRLVESEERCLGQSENRGLAQCIGLTWLSKLVSLWWIMQK